MLRRQVSDQPALDARLVADIGSAEAVNEDQARTTAEQDTLRMVERCNNLSSRASVAAEQAERAESAADDQASWAHDLEEARWIEASRASAAAEQAERAEAAADDQASRANDLEEARWIEEGARRATEARRIGEAR